MGRGFPRTLLLLWIIGVHPVLDARQHPADVTVAATAPASYKAPTHRTILPEPALPTLGPAGHRFLDPTFGSRLLRVTDPSTRPGSPGRSFTVPSAAHQLAWNATSDRFYIRSVDGFYIPYNFNSVTMTASRIQPTTTGDGGLTISSQVEPQFSFLSANVIFGSYNPGPNDWPVVRKFDFGTLTYSDVLDLGTIPGAALASATYAGALSSSAVSPEKVAVMYGGPAQDSHFKVAVFQAGNPGPTAVVLDTHASTITAGGIPTPTNLVLNFNLHHAWIDQSGEYVVLYPVAQQPVPFYIWTLATNTVMPVTRAATGHDATGFGSMVNQSCCTSSPEDAAQWQWRALNQPALTRDLISPVVTPQEIFLADHTSWNNAQPDALVPILSAPYRYCDGGCADGTLNSAPWRPWDDEIIAIQTTGSTRVWRFAHHRSNVDADVGAAAVYFWYLPRANISPNGRWAIFSSNWEKTLGSTIPSDASDGGLYRADVFVLELSRSFTDEPLTIGTLVQAVHFTELRWRIDALRIQRGMGQFAWTDPGLGPGTVIRGVHLTDLRTALSQVYTAANTTGPTFTDPSIVPGSTIIRAVHIQELRNAIVALEPE